MNSNGTYGGDKSTSSDVEYATDPASGGFFNSDYKKNDDLKRMLDVNKDSMNLEAMKRIIGMIARGKDASDLFPSVVKNVVSKNIEVKKLVYVYLVRYAEEQQDLALLSISTFQRALKDPNQLIRASALRVLSSIRVAVIVPIVMLAIKDAANDMSPYVRKTAAHAIPKLYALDAEQKEELMLMIEKLLSDKTTLVVGSAVMAFEEVCPEKIELIHKNYRKLCNLLVDVDEWGQVIIVNMLTRYARTQFTDPHAENEDEDLASDKKFYDEDSESGSDKDLAKKKDAVILDPDHKLLLRSAKPLLQSRNAAVVMSVAQLYHHCAPSSDVDLVSKALIRLLRSHREVQSVVLNSIAAVSVKRKNLFEPFLKSFFVRSNDPTYIKILKLEILTNLATPGNISVILREFQTYMSNSNKEFVAAAVHAIGRCASNIKQVRESCLNGLVSVLSNKDESVVAESVVVVKKLLQTDPSAHVDIIAHMARLIDHITVPQARASILWLLGEYSYLVPKIAPDVLRKMAKSFISEEDIVKLQILNLAVKLFLTNGEQTELLCRYVMSLARYDQNYDIRDRSRLLRHVLFPANPRSILSSRAKDIFLAPKPAPLLVSKFIDREEFQMGSLSHYINAKAIGYHDLPAFPAVQPDPSVRFVPLPESEIRKENTKTMVANQKKKSFYADLNENDETEDSTDETNSDASSSEEESDDEETCSKEELSEKSSEESSSEENDGSDNESSEESEIEPPKRHNKISKTEPSKETKDIDLLLELDDLVSSDAAMTPRNSSFLIPLTPALTNSSKEASAIRSIQSSFIPKEMWEVLNKINGKGQLSVLGRFTRTNAAAMLYVELIFQNHYSETITNINLKHLGCTSTSAVLDFVPISALAQTEKRMAILGINFNDSTQPIKGEISWNCGELRQTATAEVVLKAPIGELIKPVAMPDFIFIQEQSKLKGMNEHSAKISLKERDNSNISEAVYKVANFSPAAFVNNSLRYCAQTLSSQSLVFLTISRPGGDGREALITVHCEKLVVGAMLLNEIKTALNNE